MNRRLDVLLRGRPVAVLDRGSSGAVELTYRPGARGRIDALSVALPVRSAPFADNECRNVLDWLLPEKQVRANIAQRIHADPDDTFALLAEYGRECAGAVEFVDPERPEPAPSVHWLSERELAGRIDHLSTHPFLSFGEDDVELSLGGVQEKALVVVDGDRVGLPRHGAVSTHILKPDISDRIRSVLAEGLALRTARTIGLPGSASSVRRVGERLVLFVERFDRIRRDDGALTREHHETAAQALDVAPLAKYEIRGGPGITELGRLVRSVSTDVARDLRYLTSLVLFNALIGNADAHIGNYGLLHRSDGAVRLSPAYDLVPVAAVLGRPPKGYAMRIGGSFEFGALTDVRMQQLAAQLEVATRGVIRLRDELRDALPGALVTASADIADHVTLDEPESAWLEHVVSVVAAGP